MGIPICKRRRTRPREGVFNRIKRFIVTKPKLGAFY